MYLGNYVLLKARHILRIFFFELILPIILLRVHFEIDHMLNTKIFENLAKLLTIYHF